MDATGKPDVPAEGRGRKASGPRGIPLRGWVDILTRVVQRTIADRIGMAAASVAFFAILSLVPAIALTVSIYGLYTSPATIGDQIDLLRGFFPGGGLDLLHTELQRITSARDQTLSLSIVLTLILSLWGSSGTVRAMFQAMNIAYNETENRGFFYLIFLTTTFTVLAILFAVVVLNLVLAMPVLTAIFGLGSLAGRLGAIVPPVLMLVLSNVAIGALYRWGPSRRGAKWRWISIGSVLASLVWMLAAAAFAFYLSNWSNYDATYGSLGTIIGLMMWFFISAFIVILGAELNAEIEHQTLRDSTIGDDRPFGARGAYMADTLGEGRNETD